MWVKAIFFENGTPKTGLSPTVNIYDMVDNSLVVNAGVMTEVADGFYKYDFTVYNATKSYSMIADSITLTGSERYAAGDVDSISTDGFKKGVAVTNFQFLLVDSDGEPSTGLTVAGTISKDGGVFASITPGTVVEISNGMYKIDLSATEMSADILTVRFTSTGASDRLVTLITNE